MTLVEKICELVRNEPGLSQTQIAARLFGPGAYQQRVSYQCQYLVRAKDLERRGDGLQSMPYRYYPARKTGQC
jgi:hypothetical protein